MTYQAITRAVDFTLDQLEPRRLLAAVDPMPVGTFSAAPGQAATLGDATFFATYDRTNGQVLWASNGIASETRLIKDIETAPSTASTWYVSGRQNALVVNGIYYFTAVDNAHGRELWRSDGTPDGTYMVRDIVAGAGDSDPEGFVDVNGQLFFTANRKIWKTDGTEGGTQQVRAVDPLGFHDAERMATRFGELYFTTYPAGDPYFGSNNTGQLWKTNGQAGGTTLVADINGTEDSTDAVGPRFNLIHVNDTIYFTAGNSTHGYELWRTDGTHQGTRMVADIAPGPASSTPTDLVMYKGSLYFSAAGGLWKSDGTPEGTVRVSDVANPTQLTVVHRTLYFVSDTEPYGRELWHTDGTGAGTKLARDIRPETAGESADSDPDSMISYGGHVFFRANDGTHGYELWHSDGTVRGTIMLNDFAAAGSSVAMPFAAIGGRVLSASRDPVSSRWSVASVAIPGPSRPERPMLEHGFDTGVSRNDNNTQKNQPEFIGEAMAGATVRLYADGVEVGRTIAEDGTWSIVPFQKFKDGRYQLTAAATDELGNEGEPSERLSFKVDNKAPSASLASANLQSVKVRFTDHVGGTLALDDMSLQRLDNGAVIPASAMLLQFDDKTNVATITFPGLPGGVLPSVPYRLTISARSVADLAGNRLDRKTGMEFFPGAVSSASKQLLRVVGTSAADDIVIKLNPENDRFLQVVLNGQTTEYPVRQYSSVKIDAAGGNDTIRFDHSAGQFKLAARIYGGAGADTIFAGAGRDRIYAGPGNDVIWGGSSGDILYGDEGDDLIYGEAGNDYIAGGSGADSIFGNRGADRILKDANDDLTTDETDFINGGAAA